MKLSDQRTKGVISVLIASFGFGTMPVVAQLAFQVGMSSQTLLASRFIVAAGLIWAYVLSRKLPFRLPGLQILYLLSIGILSIGVGLFLAESYQYIPGVIAT